MILDERPMNIQLLSTFQENYPKEFDGILDCASMAVCCAFNKVGSMLAVGCSDGRLVIWDFLTRGIAKTISADWSPICCVSWSKKSDFIATSSIDNTVSVWNTSTGRCRTRISCIQSPVLKVQFHPRDTSHLLICPLKHPPVLVDQTGQHKIVTMDEESNDVVSTFDRKGAHIILGNSRGLMMIKTFPELKTISSFRIAAAAANTNTILKHIEMPRRGPYCLVNTSDRIIRIYNYADMLSCGINCDLEPKQKLQDLVNKSLWRKCCWSGDGEYICGASSRQHSLYIWETASGTLVTILRGAKGEALADVCWHPVRPIIASISSGVVSVWSHSQVENWSAFAPDFRELEENVEYNERESEFDVRDEDRSLDDFDLHGPPNKRQRSDTNGHERKFDDETIEIDVVNEQRIEALVSSDDEDINDQLVYLPCAPDIEDPDVECPASATNMAKPRPLSPSISARAEADELFEIQLPIPPVQDPHPYQNGMKPTRSVATPTTTVPEFSIAKRDDKQRRKGHSHSHGDAIVSTCGIAEQTILLPKAIDAAVVTVTQSGTLPLSTQTSQIKRQRARSTRLEGRKATDTAPVLPNTQTSMMEETSLISPVKPIRQHTHSTDHHPDSIPQ